MEIRTETVYVARMTRLEAARTLVDPKELLQALRARLGSNGSEDEIIEGQAVTRALPAGKPRRSAHVRRAMKKLGNGKRVKCPHCDRDVTLSISDTEISVVSLPPPGPVEEAAAAPPQDPAAAPSPVETAAPAWEEGQL